jgi:chaperonin GroEL
MSIPKQITQLSDNDFLVNTVKEFCEPVISTLGPGGCTVIIADDDNPLPHVTKDGVTVAESIYFKDKRKQAIAALIKEAARKTATTVGDGTTTSIVLAEAMIIKGIEILAPTSKKLPNPVTSKKEFFNGFDLAIEKVTDYLTDSSTSIAKDSKLLSSVVKISSNNDDRVVKTIMSAVKEAGADGIINVELHDGLTTEIDVKGGASLESKAIITGAKIWERVVGSNYPICLILVASPLKHTHEIKQLILQLNTRTCPAILIAKEFSDEVVNTIVVNNQRKVTDIVLVEAEGFAKESRMDILGDLSAIFDVPILSLDGSTGYFLNEHIPYPCEGLSKAIIRPTETILFRVEGFISDEAQSRYNALKKEYDEFQTLEGDKDLGTLRHLQRRMAKYNVVATIKVGASTKAEATEIKDRIDDSMCAIAAAVNGGIVQGGGMALVRASVLLDSLDADKLTESEQAGYDLVQQVCLSPFKTLAKNVGIVALPETFNDDLLEETNVYDFKSCQIVNWLEAGIIDPTLVSITALLNAASVAKTILKSNSIISEWQED